MIRNFLASIDPLLKVGGVVREMLTEYFVLRAAPQPRKYPKTFSGRLEIDQNRSASRAPAATTMLGSPSNLVREIDMSGKYLDNACVDCQTVPAALNIRNRQLCQ